MYSFYGGRPGNSFVIITSYRSIADMVANFRLGPNYTAVHYDEHVIINTVNKNDPDNGKIYRRGYDFNNSMGGAEYVGTIVGPAGKAPLLEMTTQAGVASKQSQEGYQERRSSGSYTVTSGNLVPGKTGNGTFNDAITWKCCSIRNQNNEDCTAYIGFTIPYTIIDYESSSVDPYAGGSYSDTSSTTRVDDGIHPFYEKWHINVPKGVKGDAGKNFRVETASTSIQNYDGRADDINNNRQVLIYDYYNYDTYQNGHPVTIYLGDYNIIENVQVDEQGTITVSYTHNDDSVFTKAIKWIDQITLNTSTGLFTIVYNHTTDAEGQSTTYTTYLDWIKTVSIDNDGTVTFGHTHENDTVFDNLIKWVTGVTINNNGTVTFTWNNGSSDTVFSNIIQWISGVNLGSDGTLTVSYNNGASPTVFSKTIKWITNVNVANDGTVTVQYNNDDPDYVATNRIKWINNITMDNYGTITISYNNGSSDTVFSNIVKWIDDVAVGDDGTMTVSYNNNSNDTVFSKKIKWLTGATLASNGTFSMGWNNTTDSTVYANLFKWISGATVSSNGTLTFTWNNGDASTVFSNLMKWVNNITIATNGTVTITWNNGDPNTVFANLIKWIDDLDVDTGETQGEGDQKLHITWNDGTTEDIGNPINYIMEMIVNNNNHLLVRYSDPVRRENGISYNNISGWSDLGAISQQYEYEPGDSAADLTWIGLGQIVDDGTNNKKVIFSFAPLATVSPLVNTVYINAGTLDGDNTTDTITALDMSATGVTTITKTLTGLQFEVDSGIASSGAAATEFINLSISNMELEFTVVEPQPTTP